jgi:hypothetical protein
VSGSDDKWGDVIILLIAFVIYLFGFASGALIAYVTR